MNNALNRNNQVCCNNVRLRGLFLVFSNSLFIVLFSIIWNLGYFLLRFFPQAVISLITFNNMSFRKPDTYIQGGELTLSKWTTIWQSILSGLVAYVSHSSKQKQKNRGRRGGGKEKTGMREKQRCSEVVLTWADATKATAKRRAMRDCGTTDVMCS